MHWTTGRETRIPFVSCPSQQMSHMTFVASNLLIILLIPAPYEGNMKQIILIFLIVTFITLPISAGQFRIIKVSDGDTVLAVGHDITIKVQLIGIDAPETGKRKNDPGQPFSQASKKYLTKLILNRAVEIRGYGLGPYNRIIGKIFIDGKNVNLEMLYSGMAEVYKGKSPKNLDKTPFLNAESKAKAMKKGVWSLVKYESPMDYRKRKSRKKHNLPKVSP